MHEQGDIIASDSREKEVSPFRLVLTLAIAGLISGVAIIGIYEATFDTIAANRAQELKEAVFRVLPGIARMQELVYRDGNFVAGEAENDEQSVYAGYTDDGKFFGYAIPGEGPGFQDTIKLLYGYRPETGNIVGMWVLESRETPGLGDKIYKDENFVAEFDELSINPRVVLVKDDADEPNQVDAITGATISSTAVVNIINQTNDMWIEKLPDKPPEAPLDEAN